MTATVMSASDALRDLVDSWSWTTAGVTAAGVWLLTRAERLLGRRIDDALDRGWTRAGGWLSLRRSTGRQASLAQKQETLAAKRLDALKQERLGAKFRFRASADDSGMLGDVVELASRDPQTRVIMIWSNPQGREASDDDYAEGRRISMEWRHLVMPTDAQRHRTARLIARSGNDMDGWVEFERIEDGGQL